MGWTVGLLWGVGLSGLAWGKGPKVEEPAGGGGMLMPDLGKVLGPEWEVPPELSDRAQPGPVIEVTLGGYKRVMQGCVAAQPYESPVTSVSMQSSLSGGVGWGGGLVKASAEASRMLKLNFQGPFVLSFDEVDFVPSATCVQKLQEVASRGTSDPTRWVLVQEALMARVSGCQEASASAGVSLPGGGAAVQTGGMCQMFSEAPVAVGVKTRAVVEFPEFRDLVAAPPAPAPVATRPAPAPAPAPSAPAPRVAGSGWRGSSGYEMVWVPAGRYTMGCTAGQSDCGDDETKHWVELTRGFYLGATEVTQGLWTSVMGTNPSGFSDCGPTCPVETVSWLDAVRFANALSAREGLPACYEEYGEEVRWPGGLGCTGYRLPTESEWEVAARGGADLLYAGSNTAGEVAWTDANAGELTHPVRQLRSNGWGLYDMSGNVWEWVWDVYGQYPGAAEDPVGASSGAYRVIRGGCWIYDPWYARVASRLRTVPGLRYVNLGFRLARTVP